MKLSAVLAVRDEEEMLPSCLDLLGFADEIVVVIDTRTTDATEEIARRYTDRVFLRDFDDFASQKNHALAQARGEWALIVDADERIPADLADEILATIATDPPKDAYSIETINYFMGTRMSYGGWKESHVRLVRRDKVSYDNALHEAFTIAPGRLGELRGGMWHFSHRSVVDNLVKTANYISIESQAMLEAGHPPVRARTLFWVTFKELVHRLVYRRGYRDGMVGIIESLYQPFSKLVLHIMLWERQQKPSIPERYRALDEEARAGAKHPTDRAG